MSRMKDQKYSTEYGTEMQDWNANNDHIYARLPDTNSTVRLGYDKYQGLRHRDGKNNFVTINSAQDIMPVSVVRLQMWL